MISIYVHLSADFSVDVQKSVYIEVINHCSVAAPSGSEGYRAQVGDGEVGGLTSG